MTTEMMRVFDGHNDVLLRLYLRGGSFFDSTKEGHIDLPRARRGGLAGGFCALSVPPEGFERAAGDPGEAARRALALYRDESTMPPTPELGYAQRFTLGLMALLLRIERQSEGQVKIVRTAAELQSCLDTGVFAALMHIEGAEAIDPELDALEVFHQVGLRSLGPVWSRPNAFGHGVPFKFDHSPDTGPGLTDAGKALLRACNDLHILFDVSHLNEKGFWDVARLTQAPIVATHSNVHAISPATRNLTEKQLDAIKDSDGMVGVNFHVGFIREDGKPDPDTSLDAMVRHVDYLVERIGIERVGFGSDFDGAVMPRDIGDVGGLPNLIAALRRHGYDEAALRRLAHENWARVLRATWGA